MQRVIRNNKQDEQDRLRWQDKHTSSFSYPATEGDPVYPVNNQFVKIISI